MSDSFRLGLGLGLMFCSGWMIHSALMAARDLVVDYLRYQQQKAKDHPWSWDCPASIRHLEASLLEWLTSGRQGFPER
jgi:hypothetical protein